MREISPGEINRGPTHCSYACIETIVAQDVRLRYAVSDQSFPMGIDKVASNQIRLGSTAKRSAATTSGICIQDQQREMNRVNEEEKRKETTK